jgi:hypothetical protein
MQKTDFSDKILVAVGDSFVYGHLGDDIETESCHSRSWVKKLEILGKFKSSINLGAPGGSNQRSYRVLMDFLNDRDVNEQYYIIFATTELARFELPIGKEEAGTCMLPLDNYCPFERKHSYQNYTAGPWTLEQLEKFSLDTTVGRDLHKYLSLHYGYFYHEIYQRQMLDHYLTSVHLTLKYFNIEHSFVQFIGNRMLHSGVLKNLNIELPVINFYYKDTRYKAHFQQFMSSHNYNAYPCAHYDDVGNRFIAEYILWQISTMREKKDGI